MQNNIKLLNGILNETFMELFIQSILTFFLVKRKGNLMTLLKQQNMVVREELELKKEN